MSRPLLRQARPPRLPLRPGAIPGQLGQAPGAWRVRAVHTRGPTRAPPARGRSLPHPRQRRLLQPRVRRGLEPHRTGLPAREVLGVHALVEVAWPSGRVGGAPAPAQRAALRQRRREHPRGPSSRLARGDGGAQTPSPPPPSEAPARKPLQAPTQALWREGTALPPPDREAAQLRLVHVLLHPHPAHERDERERRVPRALGEALAHPS